MVTKEKHKKGDYLCDWCSNKVYDIAVDNNGEEDLLCEDCYETYKEGYEEEI
jgi:hypothetical protein